MDWMALCRRKPDLTGLNGARVQMDIDYEEVSKHKKEDDAWVVINRVVGMELLLAPDDACCPIREIYLLQLAWNRCVMILMQTDIPCLPCSSGV